MNAEEQIRHVKKDIICLQDSIISNKIEIKQLKRDLKITFMVIQFLLGVALTLAGISFFVK